MMVSPFTFYRGAAKIMAADLKDTPTAGLNVQLCGDAHLSNFGVFASPERTLLFDLNDFDETLPGPVRVRREAHGGELHDRGAQQRLHQGRRARRDARLGDGLPGGDGRVRRDAHDGHLVRAPVRAGPDERDRAPRPAHGEQAARRRRRRRRRRGPQKTAEKAHTRDSLQALSKLAELVDGQLPDRQPAADRRPGCATWPRAYGISADEIEHTIHEQFRAYRATLQDDRRHLLERFEVVDVARKVVGVGSVGTRAFIVLLQGRDQAGPAVPAGQGGHRVGARGSPAEEPLPPARRAGRAGPADDAGRERHLPGLDQGRARPTATCTGASCAT